MLDLAWLCSLAVKAVYWLVLLACNFLGYSPVWAKNAWKRSIHEKERALYKKPSHLAVLYNERKVDKAQLLSLFDCCLRTGIRQLSIFDPWNDAASFLPSLNVICKRKNIDVYSNSSPRTDNKSLLTVQLLPASHGRQAIVDVCKQMTRSSKPISINSIGKSLHDSFGLSDPDLLIMVGNVPSLAGYPPFNLRITEFTQVRNLPCARGAFEDCLITFGNRDIRVGK